MHLMPAETTSYWLKTAETTEHPVLRQSLEPDVLIVGGGITGITCAYELAKRGHKPVVIEAGEIGCETTGKTTGKLTIQHGLIYSALADKYGLDYAGMYVRSQTEALDFAKNIAAESSIPCQMAPSNAYLYASAQEDLKALEKERAVAAGLGVQCTLLHNKSSFPESFGMLMFAGQAVFHPVRYVRGLARQAVALGAAIFCRTKALVVNNDHEPSVTCENGVTIKPRHLVLATQYPIYSGPNLFFTRLYAKRSYAIAVKAERDWPEGSYINVSGRTRSFRTHWENGERILIVAGEDHPTGRSEIDMDRRFMNLVSFAEKHAGVREVLAKWSAQDYDTPDQIPYIDRISGSSTIYVATGFKKWGLTSGTLAGLLIPELIETGACRYEALYSKNAPTIQARFQKPFPKSGSLFWS
jgi:glycine/D-amino acid oxidase-like deaminating enzyme